MMTKVDAPRRLKFLTLERFRGFGLPFKLDIDADVVIVSAPNGHGKTTVVDGIGFLLNGMDPRRADRILPSNSNGQGVVSGELSDGIDSKNITMSMPGATLESQLHSLASVFYQDHLTGLPTELLVSVVTPNFEDKESPKQRLGEIERRLQQDLGRYATSLPHDARTIEEEGNRAWENFIGELSAILPPDASRPTSNNRPKNWQARLRTLSGSAWLAITGESRTFARSEPVEAVLEALGVRVKLELDGRRTKRSAIDQIDPLIELSSLLESHGNRPCANWDSTLSPPLLDPNRPGERGLFPVELPDNGHDEWDRSVEALVAKANQAKQSAAMRRKEADSLELWIAGLRAAPNRPGFSDTVGALRSHASNWLALLAAAPAAIGQPDVDTLAGALSDATRMLGPVEEVWSRVEKSIVANVAYLRNEQNGLSDWAHVQESVNSIVAKLDSGARGRIANYADQIRSGNLTCAGLADELKSGHRISEAMRSPSSEDDRLESLLSALRELLRNARRAAENHAAVAADRASVAAMDAIKTSMSAISSVSSALDRALLADASEADRITRHIKLFLGYFRTLPHIKNVKLEVGDVGRRPKVRRAWQMRFQIDDDNSIGLEDLSTGQRAVVQLCLLLALNIALADRLPHDVVVLDDFTTALDLGQLPAVASVLRHLAYADEPVPGQHRRQIILTSHHEDLTNRMISLLQPPLGRTMKVVEIVDWSVTKGATCRTYRARSPQGDQADVEQLVRSTVTEALDFLGRGGVAAALMGVS